ncbi:pseudaminic acid synthase [Hymenobacter yonginensis]|uniref:Pseudaminic acid synthase n=1 Tax=Hymenobacter yonginensis TaxID=748197 RepID=A0ABY7PS32_9BACT|nr:pseudaminic acid synthase [Hymenobacter yonginensis]WBO85667.1 pseudaminic acid synthase [Hymenobacter yonginensis]
MTEITIAGRPIGVAHKPFIIAEMSGNHNQSLERALRIVDAAAAAGVDAIKLQTYTADTITMDTGFVIREEGQSLWEGRSLYKLYQEAYTPWEWHAEIFAYARQKGLLVFSSPFDETAVDFLETLDAPAYKIASFENTHHPLLRKVAATGKPVIMSTGVATLAEIDEAVRVLRSAGCRELVLLKCTSTYPASPENTNLRTIPTLIDIFNCPVGLSDHTMGIGASVAAVALGACVIEKHFTLSRAEGGVDSAFSMEPAEMASIVTETERAWQALGHVQLCVQATEEKSRIYKRSIYVSKPIAAGEEFTPDNLRIIRPGDGLEPRHWEQVLGRQASHALAAGTALTWDAL